jgi:hypothetical protein
MMCAAVGCPVSPVPRTVAGCRQVRQRPSCGGAAVNFSDVVEAFEAFLYRPSAPVADPLNVIVRAAQVDFDAAALCTNQDLQPPHPERIIHSAQIIAALVDDGHEVWCRTHMWRDVVGCSLHPGRFATAVAPSPLACLADPVTWAAAGRVFGRTSREMLVGLAVNGDLVALASHVAVGMRLAALVYPSVHPSLPAPVEDPLFRDPWEVFADPWVAVSRVLDVLGADVLSFEPSFVRSAEASAAAHLASSTLHEEMLAKFLEWSSARPQSRRLSLSSIGEAVDVAAATVRSAS